MSKTKLKDKMEIFFNIINGNCCVAVHLLKIDCLFVFGLVLDMSVNGLKGGLWLLAENMTCHNVCIEIQMNVIVAMHIFYVKLLRQTRPCGE